MPEPERTPPAAAVRAARRAAARRPSRPAQHVHLPLAEVHERRRAVLLHVVETEVVPRLLRAHAAPAASGTAAPGAAALDGAPALELARSLLRDGPAPADARVGALLDSGVTPEAVCTELLSGAARHLGEMWVQDTCSFADVTLATGALQRLLLRDVAPRLATASVPGPAPGSAAGSAPGPIPAPASAPAPAPGPAPAGTVLLMQAPGEQHGFGLSMLAAFFRAAGWTVGTPVVSGAPDAARAVAAGVGGRRVDVVGFSLGAEANLSRLRRCIDAVRGAASGPPPVMVGGPALLARPGLAAALGADATAASAPEAVARAAALLRARRAAG